MLHEHIKHENQVCLLRNNSYLCLEPQEQEKHPMWHKYCDSDPNDGQDTSAPSYLYPA
jgi:hypothetical protein